MSPMFESEFAEDSTNLCNCFGVFTWSSNRLDVLNRCSNSFVDTTLKIHWVHACSYCLQTFVNDGLSQNSRSRSTVTSVVVLVMLLL